MKPFDLLTCPLEGVNLIEASAGTGKTYALSGLFLRFLLEKKLSAKQILVITFTNAATAELKSRIRRMIVDARFAFISGDSQNTFIKYLLEKYPDEENRTGIIRQLNDALAGYDDAAIYTIHGFCQRVLADNAFASGVAFDADFIADQKDLEKEFVEDFWRRHFYDNHPIIIRYLQIHGFSFELLLGMLQMALTHPDAKITPDDIPFSRDELDRELAELNGIYDLIKKRWINVRPAILELLRDRALSGQVYGKKADGILTGIDDVLQAQDIPLPPPTCIVKLSKNELIRKTNKNQKTPSHDIFDLCQQLCDQAYIISSMLENYLAGLKREFLKRAKIDFPGLKKQRNILYFDDLLNRTCEAVNGPDGKDLTEILRKQYSAILVDEFQDTDPIQYAILQSVFIHRDGLNGHVMFYIGDPKQAIYSFRGADIYAYLRAEKSVDERYTMTSNWRSEQTLINAVNVLFGKPSNAFVYHEIGYALVERPAEQKTKSLIVQGDDPAGLYWWFVPGRDDGKATGVTAARSYIIQAVTSEISRLLKAGFEKKAFIGEKPLAAGDIAVLVRKNSEAVALKNALLNAGIPSVVYSSESVYASDQADDLRRLMLGVIYHDHERYLMSAVNTPFFSYTAEDIDACLTDGNHLEHLRIKFKKLNDSWQKKGFLTMFGGLLEEDGVRVRVASRPDGERCLTNYVHLAQLLFQMQKEEHLQPQALLDKFEEKMASDNIGQEELQQKLETDRDGVKIVTVHRSKGLEYPIVFCPFAWEKGKRQDKKMPAFFHDEKNDWQAVFDLGSENLDTSIIHAATEALAEECRLLYVALTRAKNRCYFISGNIRDTETSAVNYLFHRKMYEDQVSDVHDSSMLADIQSIAVQAPQDIKISRIKEESENAKFSPAQEDIKLSCRKFEGSMDYGWKIASYTYLARSGHEETEWDEDIHHHPFLESNNSAGIKDHILFFPSGATSGTLLHKILEKVNFTCLDDEITKSIIKDTLHQFNYSEGWLNPIFSMLQTLFNADLRRPGGVFRLSQIGPLSCRKEMEFYFPLREISIKKITSVLEQQERFRRIDREIKEKRKLNVASVKGFLKGFIDLVFQYDGRYYLADWKSNNLGERLECYEPLKLEQAIFSSLYDLQYLIYTVALNQYLKKRMPDYSYDNHFGGVYYFFLRGINASPGESPCGIYFDRPDQTLIEKLTDMMLDQNAIKKISWETSFSVPE